jgi:hypothetical protein
MDTQQTTRDLCTKAILFPNGNRAKLLAPPGGTNVADILQALDIGEPRALILVVGGAVDLDAAVQARLV